MQFENEKSFIFNCLKAFIHGTTVSSTGLDDLSSSNFNWNWIIQAGQAGRILPFLIHIFEKEGYLKYFSSGDQMGFQGVLMHSEWENRGKRVEFSKVKDLFENENIFLIPLKGIALTCLVYPETPFRSMADVDILIQENDLQKAREILLSNGFMLSETKNRWQAKPMMNVIGRWSFVQGNTDVDLQWCPKFFTQDGLVSWDAQGAWERAESFRQLGGNVFMLSASDQILYLSLQILNDIEINTVHMIQLLDLASVMKKYKLNCDTLLQASTLSPSLKKPLSAFLRIVEECFFEGKSYETLSSGSLAFFERFFELSPKPERGFAIRRVLQLIHSPWECFLFVIGYFVPSQSMLQKYSSSHFFGKVNCYLDHWRKQAFSFFKMVLRQR